MGLVMSRIYDRMFTRETRVLVLGLDGAGKTTILYKLKLNEFITTVPTVGFNVETVEYRNLRMSVWDVGGQDRIRSLWKHYYRGTDALIFVVDTNDHDRLAEARDELFKVLADDEMANPLVLIYANKMDLPNALPPSAVSDKLGLNSLKETWYLQPSSASSGDGLVSGLDWLSSQIKLRPINSNGAGS